MSRNADSQGTRGRLPRTPKSGGSRPDTGFNAPQRGFYSDVATVGASQKLGDVLCGPRTKQSLVWQSQRERHLPEVTRFKVPEDFQSILQSQTHGPTTQLVASDYYAKRSFDPKVQVQYNVPSGTTPRKVEVERRKRQYKQEDLNQLLSHYQINSDDLVPLPRDKRKNSATPNSSVSSGASVGSGATVKGHSSRPQPTFPTFLPLEVFDNTEFDCRTPEEWLALGIDGDRHKPVPGMALLPVLTSSTSSDDKVTAGLAPRPPSGAPPAKTSTGKLPSRQYKSLGSSKAVQFSEKPKPSRYDWVPVGMLDYNCERKLYLVKREQPSEVQPIRGGKKPPSGAAAASDKKARPAVRQGSTDSSGSGSGDEKKELSSSSEDVENVVTEQKQLFPTIPKIGSNIESEDDIHYWIPRVRLMFLAEDPTVFTRRVAHAHMSRAKTEALLRYHLYVDCMPTDEMAELDSDSVQRIVSTARSSPRLKQDQMDAVSEVLCKEVCLEFTRSHNRILFDKTVTAQPDLFPFVTLPDPEPEVVPETGMCPEVPSFPYKQIRNRFKFLSLLTSKEAIDALSHVRTECGRVVSMHLFHHSGVTKHLKLEEFQQAQSQATIQVQTYLKETWLPTLRNRVRDSLQSVNKGWFNLQETDYEIYLQSKLRKLMELIKFCMQDTLRTLVQSSLQQFCDMIHDATYSTLELPEDFEWQGDLNQCVFKPLRGTLFSLDLIIDASGIHYSTPLENFETTLVAIFDKGIAVTQSIEQLEKMVVDGKFWRGTAALLESVGAREPHINEMREYIRHHIRQAVIPLVAYAKQYEPHQALINLVTAEYISEFGSTDKTVAQVKAEIDMQLREKTNIEKTLPQSIVIGPFYVNCDTIRQALSKKRKELANALLEYVVDRLRDKAEKVTECFKEVSHRLFERPNSIEELTEQREYITTIPEKVTENQVLIDLVMQEYDLVEDYYYPLSDEEFDNRWTTLGWPRKIQEQSENCTKQLEQDEERFQKNLSNDQATFEDRLDSLEMVVAGFSGHTDLTKAAEISNDVRRVVKNLKECQDLSLLYNQRERLFNMNVTQYDKVAKLTKDFEPYKNLWMTAADWLRWHESWMNDSLANIDPEQLAANVNNAFRTIHKCTKHFKDIPGCLDVAQEIKKQIEEFKPFIPLIQGLRNQGMRNRHWEQLSEELGMNIRPRANLTFAKCLEMKLDEHIETIAKVSEIAGKEFSIEQALDKMEEEWEPILLEIIAYKETGTYIMRSGDESAQQLDDHIVMTQAMSFSPYKKPFEARIMTWENKLRITQDVMEEWMLCQRSWLYLEPIFSSEDINRQLPVESKRYQTMDRMWRKIMNGAKKDPKVISFCPDARLLENIKECNKLLDQVQKGLSDYLETKRSAFPRFYFLSDDELLEILSQTKDPTAVQPHLRKCFENIARLKFEEDLAITKMFSAEGEEVPFTESLYPKGNVEDWLLTVENVMRSSLKQIIKDSLDDYVQIPRTEWVLKWPGQVVIAGCQTFWTTVVSEAITQDDLDNLYQRLLDQLADLVGLVRGKLKKIARMMLSALIVIEVHGRDVVAKLVQEKVKNVNDFEWISQLRYYWEDDLLIRAVNATFNYGYEYLGNTGRLVITPLTDRCYLTLTGALHLKFGGAPAGPAGTGKTETTKDLAKAMAIQCVVFNCSDQLDFMAMGKFFKGLASAGAWACFDEFNRIDIEVLSVVAQQIATIQKAQQQYLQKFIFEGVEITLKASCAVFITMNPGYAGRTELPDNLKALFRPVAMMVPDYAMIAEIMLFSFGFSDAKKLAEKIVTTFKLSSEQLSSQDHYDFGMRAVKTVISAAGNLKRENPTMNEELIVLRAIRDVNVPKFLQGDLKLFNGIVSDLFPKIKEEAIDYGDLEEGIRKQSRKKGLQDVEGFVRKCIQLYETTVVRHGLMLVGPTISGKTRCYEVLKAALTSLKGKFTAGGVPFEVVHTYVLNPKSITMGQLYGEFDPLTHEWTDGILSSLIRGGASSEEPDKRWYVFDGPVDAVWIENMNTVLDDNKKLCLSSGEIIKLTEAMTMMFEVQDLAVASPATVSRCGMVYLEPSILGLTPFVTCWLEQLPEVISPYTEKFKALFEFFLESSIKFIRHSTKEFAPTVDGNLTFSLLRLLDCFFTPLIPQEGKPPIPEDQLKLIEELVEPWFYFSLVWSIGGTCDGDGRKKFDVFVREKMSKFGCAMPFPDKGLVYDYQLDDGGVSGASKTDDDDDIDEKSKSAGATIQWIGWMDQCGELSVDATMRYSDIIVPTLDTIRCSFLIELLLTNNKKVLCVGPTGTGKTLTASDKLLRKMPKSYLSHFINFSARTSANQTQDIIDSKLDKRRKGVFGPPLGKQFVFFIDDMNMPALEVYGAQPPVELIRQYMDHGGWYDRKAIGQFHQLIDINFVAAMGPPGGGRNPVTPRLLRHFNYMSFTELEDASKYRIFSSILKAWLGNFENAESLCTQLVESSIAIYNTITTELLPTPAKSHYTFNLRDLSKVFQGMLMSPIEKIKGISSLLRLWFHECLRVFQDRLVNNEDRTWFEELLKTKISTFQCETSEVLNNSPILYGDFLNPSVENKIYEEVTDHTKMTKIMEDFLDDYNQVNTAQMKLVLFLDATQHVCRISRIIRQPLGNALLLGVGGSGRQSLTRLASHMADYDCFQIELSKNYGVAEWREDIKKIMLKAGIENKSVVFLFSDTQIKSESFLEDINNILNSGDVPNIYEFEDLDNIYNTMKPIVLDAGQQPTKANLFSAYTKKVRSNIHLVICMSPIGEVFRSRLRQFPSLVTCCTIDWFSEWPDEALKSVALFSLNELVEIDNPDAIDGLVKMCVNIHQSVASISEQFLAELSRHNYVTPTSYLELLGTFSRLLKLKKSEISNARQRTKTGLDKLLSTGEEVEKLQKELEEMRPLLEQAQVDTEQTMEQIQKDTVVANETKEVVQKEEEAASAKAQETQAIAEDAQRDLDEALPALDAALASLKSLNKNDVVEVRALQRPPPGVRMVIEAVSIMKEVKPKKVAGEKIGTKVDDYWEPGKAQLQDPTKFLESLFKYDKDNISDPVITRIQPYIDNPEFEPAAIFKVSKACMSICQWVRAMHKYHFVAKNVAPKRAALAEANASLEETLKVLNEAKARLREVEEGIASLQAKYEECVAKKQELGDKCDLCTARLERAEKLIGGLADEKVRWGESVANFDVQLTNVIGDVMVSAGVVAYQGAFTGEYRATLLKQWLQSLTEYSVPHTQGVNLVSILSNPVKIRSWQICGLPRDTLSVENGVIVQFSRRWPLFIDPQGQANKWIKNLEKDHNIDVLKLTDKDFLRSLENCVRFGKPCLLENVAEELDPALEPILLQQTFKQGGSTVIKLGDAVIPYHDDFKLYITTKLPNPHYTPEVSTKVTLVNFTLSPSGLEDQLLGIVVAEERPDLEEQKNQLIVSNARMKQELKEIEDEILFRLSNSEGNPVDDVELIKALEASKLKSQEITAKVKSAEQTERDIDVTRSQYIPVAVRTQILFFCTTDLANIDPMYQYSLEWFIGIFLGSIANAEKSDDLTERIVSINDYFTFSLYSNVCRSLFEKHKLLFSFLVCVRILMNENKINMGEWHFLLSGGTTVPKKLPNPASDWLSDRAWGEVLMLAALENFAKFADEFPDHLEGFRRVFDSPDPHREPLPGHWDDDLDEFQKLLVLRCIRADKVTNAMQDFVSQKIGQRFIEPQTADLSLAYKDSSPTSSLIFILSVGTDPAADLYKFAEEMKFLKKLTAISLGQGQGPIAENLMKLAMERGQWVFFQNCHLAPSWMPNLERLIEHIDPNKVHRDFRLWLTSMPSPNFPVPVLQNGSKMTVEPPRGIKANLLKCFTNFNDEFLNGNTKGGDFKLLIFSLSLFHGVTLERRKFGALGFNIPYEFTDGDMRICVSQLNMFLNEYQDIPFKVLQYTAGHINYGGRVTDDWDRRCLMNILNDFYSDIVLNSEHSFSPSNIYHQVDPSTTMHKDYMKYIKSLPINDTPEIFGLHDNANITFAQNETFSLLNSITLLQPRASSGGSTSREDVIEEQAKRILNRVSAPINLADVSAKYPVKYEESMNTVLVQEVIRYNRLLAVIHQTLKDLLKALKGLVVMSQSLETMANSIFNNMVPELWASKAYPSLKPLAAWVIDLVDRINFIKHWIDNGIPPVFWISGFFFPQAFLTGTLQNYARKAVISIDTITFDFKVIDTDVDSLTSRPDNGCYIRGLFLEGAQWDNTAHELSESRPKELYTDMPVMWLIPTANRKPPQSGVYICPVYKTLTRAGTLSTTGHSTNYVVAVEVPSSKEQFHWIKRGVALLCALNY
ncbi:dynein axonemal heavy chain 1-like isoform X2 [Dysidea avara]|uniref:dynein axonemal heavy chain 1-like isoform X2 n=1 Tax=Dysidea avara TaxID=196820 RepID=UPI0033249A67